MTRTLTLRALLAVKIKSLLLDQVGPRLQQTFDLAFTDGLSALHLLHFTCRVCFVPLGFKRENIDPVVLPTMAMLGSWRHQASSLPMTNCAHRHAEPCCGRFDIDEREAHVNANGVLEWTITITNLVFYYKSHSHGFTLSCN